VNLGRFITCDYQHVNGHGRTGGKPLDGYFQKELALGFSYIEGGLSAIAYFAGSDFIAADIMMTILLGIAESLSFLKGRPNT